MLESEPFELDDEVKEALAEVIQLLNNSQVFKEYKAIELKVEGHQGLVSLVEEIKARQKDAVQFAHYGKPVAEKEAIKKADYLTKEFDQHALVIRYREKLREANDVLQHLTKRLEFQFNEQLGTQLYHYLKEHTLDINESKDVTK
ncbi:YlbF family regulator [Vagococcus intermedius]|uniref:YlbF family regulator n=1 Tax=Vagococcus intermedius TaxID=2991418 RepID=A0AAF0CVE4_9ENTE|nr:YlbF family regulator [Vagococcus intermedius]WEG73432.1 YlbF family regulator [Vagococcus intermedius]WEG75515.1 YlbF family regulator [Vagococcus intermedius]